MSMSKKQIIKSAASHRESIFLLCSVICILFAWAILVYGRMREDEEIKLESWQISAFAGLNSVEQGIYSDLRVAADDIYHNCLDNGGQWLSCKDAADEGLPPFAKGVAWSKRGKLQWQKMEISGEAVDTAFYLGSTSLPEVSGSFLLRVHRHKNGNVDGPPYKMWYKPGQTEWPLSFLDQFLVSDGWKEIQAYRGSDELKRLKGVGN